jgi:hypothetical protein
MLRQRSETIFISRKFRAQLFAAQVESTDTMTPPNKKKNCQYKINDAELQVEMKKKKREKNGSE